MARLVGGWRIAEMDLWDRDAIDLLGPAFIEFTAEGTGRFRFIAVGGNLDFRHDERATGARVEFTWEGDDDGSHVFGRGWAELEPDGSLCGRIFFHLGDDSGFRAIADASGCRTSGLDGQAELLVHMSATRDASEDLTAGQPFQLRVREL